MKYQAKIEVKPGKFAYVPTKEARERGQDILAEIRTRWLAPEHYFHLEKPGGHVACAQHHINSRYFALIDLKGFFGNVSTAKIERALKSLKFSYKEAREIAVDSCVIESGRRFVPYGFVQSALIATLALDAGALGQAIRKVLETGVLVSVYMDDILLSHPTDYNALEQAYSTLLNAAEQAAFPVSATKCQRPSESVKVFNIDLGHGNMKVTNDRFEIFYQGVIRSRNPFYESAILGYISTINSTQVAQMETRLSLPPAFMPSV